MNIRSRAQWGARYTNGWGSAPLPAEFLYLHHTVTRGTGDAAMRTVEDVGKSRFGGVSYTFCVDNDGTVYEGHSIDRKGAHTKGLNSRARAISAIGNYDENEPSPAMQESIAQLVAHGYRQGWWPARLTGGHRDAPGASTACPGRHLYARIPAINKRVAQILAAQGAPTPPPSEEDVMTADQEKALKDRLDRLLKSNTRIEAQNRALAKALTKVEGIAQTDLEVQLVDISEQRAEFAADEA